VKRATLGDIQLAVSSAIAYQRWAKCSIADAVDVVCDYQGLPHDADRRIVRDAVVRRLDRGLPDELLARARGIA
jgi:hypothetical protein